jgi:hypothetical protein
LNEIILKSYEHGEAGEAVQMGVAPLGKRDLRRSIGREAARDVLKLCDIVGLYIDPPAHAMVLSLSARDSLEERIRQMTPGNKGADAEALYEKTRQV